MDPHRAGDVPGQGDDLRHSVPLRLHRVCRGGIMGYEELLRRPRTTQSLLAMPSWRSARSRCVCITWDGRGEATVAMDTFQVARIAYCTADHEVSPNVFAWIYRQINDDLTFQMDCHAVECESKLVAKKLAHSMMEAFKKTFHSMRSDGRIHKSGSSDEFPEDSSTPDDG
ncbi:hypothetical protein MHYP_G00119640 [Metynnis hypsauchen]